MVASAYLGLPLTLAGVGAVLKLEQQKMTEGKALIRYFCVPYDTIHGVPKFRSPADAPDKWQIFKAYNKRDVEQKWKLKLKSQSFLCRSLYGKSIFSIRKSMTGAFRWICLLYRMPFRSVIQ